MPVDKQAPFLFLINQDFSITIHIGSVIFALIVALIVLGFVFRFWRLPWRSRYFEIDSAEFGMGDHKISFRPNDTDRQIAYAIWVELSTRKIGLPIDLEHDVISDIYTSWYNFFGVTRDLIKSIPVSKVKEDSTSKIINLSIEVLNEGLRPHLTRWQARFRHWYEAKLQDSIHESPQDLQQKFPRYEELKDDLLQVNQVLIAYRKKMKELLFSR